MGYRLNRLDEPVFMAVPKIMLTEFGIHYRLESCVGSCRTMIRVPHILEGGIYFPLLCNTYCFTSCSPCAVEIASFQEIFSEFSQIEILEAGTHK